MYATRVFKLLLLALGLIAVAQAHVRHIVRGEDSLQARQGGSLNIGGDASVSTTAAGDGSSSDENNTSTTTREEETSTTEKVAETTTTQNNPTTTTDAAPTTTTTTSQTPEETTSAQNDNTSAAPATTTSENTAPTTTRDNNEAASTTADSNGDSTTTGKVVISTAVETVTRTNSDGTKETLTSSTITTTTPDPQSGNNKDGGSGMSANTRNIVVGVVVGVGGAFLLGALAVVAWRIRARKRAAEEDAGLMGEYNGGYTQVDKGEPLSTAGGHTTSGTMTSTGHGPSPFQSTLEGYHAPTQPVNASSNF